MECPAIQRSEIRLGLYIEFINAIGCTRVIVDIYTHRLSKRFLVMAYHGQKSQNQNASVYFHIELLFVMYILKTGMIEYLDYIFMWISDLFNCSENRIVKKEDSQSVAINLRWFV